jgi:hypothetical protein
MAAPAKRGQRRKKMAYYEIINLKNRGEDLENCMEIVQATTPYEAALKISKLFDGMEWFIEPQPTTNMSDALFMVSELKDPVTGSVRSISLFA